MRVPFLSQVLLAKDGITGSYGIRLGEILDKDGKQRVYVTHASPAPVLAGCADGPTGYHDASLKMLLLGDELVGVSRACVFNMTEACERLKYVANGGTAIVWVSLRASKYASNAVAHCRPLCRSSERLNSTLPTKTYLFRVFFFDRCLCTGAARDERVHDGTQDHRAADKGGIASHEEQRA